MSTSTRYPILSALPKHYRVVTVFDVETTGLLPKRNSATGTYPPLDEYPHVIQMSWVKYDLTTSSVIASHSYYVKLLDGIVINDFVSNLTGITNEQCETQGIPIHEILAKFYVDYVASDVLVAHNAHFDKVMIRTELKRHSRDTAMAILGNNCSEQLCRNMETTLRRVLTDEHLTELHKTVYCTMMATVQMCGIKVNNGTRVYDKYPKLSELHDYLFGYVPENLHDSMIDSLVCLRCFLKVRCGYTIPDMKFSTLLRKFTNIAPSTTAGVVYK